ncbi:MAG: tRNA (adenosine(37)-N6)-threonylcarbamoyltransferase complex ATPase subunit type 1 TsaE [Firmicutes bacterium HGW-Firmicutes-14]|nr:MAG: tRNA (adenosine(37)-N6)-threonylcarbamoyltransferase complex ATPase subunit type 1 TsaE [Firmicutes bacterium HGW-Firmicutes-14]
MEILSSSPEKTIEVGRALGALLKPGDVICLEGDLGAGKTHFAKGIALGLGVGEHVTSPTFTLINEYEGRLPMYHVDAYRLEDEDEAYELGLEEYLYGTGVTIIEWPGNIRQILPGEHLEVKIIFPGIGHDSDLTGTGSTEDFNSAEKAFNTRKMVIKPAGKRYERLIEELKSGVYSRG